MKRFNMHREYIEHYKEYSQKYGKNTAIFLQVGSFYELYDIKNKETGETQCNTTEVVDLLGIQLSTKKGDFSEQEEGLFAGFPDSVLHKWAGRLTSDGWSVIVINQVRDDRGKIKERKVARILTPSTHIENISSTDTPYLLQLYFHTSYLYDPPNIGAALLDLTTGTTYTYSCKAVGRTDHWTMDTVIQLIRVFQPKEIMIQWRGGLQMPSEIIFRRILGISSSIIPIRIKFIDNIGAFSNELVRTEYLQKIYTIRSLLPPRTYLGLKTEAEEIALLFLLQCVEENYESMLRSFHRNESWVPESRLVCANNALTQLQMTGINLAETVIGIFDKCLTPMGRRHIKERLLRPYSDPNDIQTRLNEVAYYLDTFTEIQHMILTTQLRMMYDLPRLHRRLLCGLITITELSHLFQTYHAMEYIHTKIVMGTILSPTYTTEEWRKYRSIFDLHFSETKIMESVGSVDSSGLNILTYPKMYEIEKEITSIIDSIRQLGRTISRTASLAEDAIRVEERTQNSNGEPYGFRASSIVLQQLKKNITKLPHGIRISELKTGGWIDCTELQHLNTRIQKGREKICNLWNQYIIDACLEISAEGNLIWTQAEQWISHLDTTRCIGIVSRERGYVCPIIVPFTDNITSSVEIKQMRHPLIEQTLSREVFVKHDVAIGYDSDGWIIGGFNGVGKTCCMKSVGLCVLLAQAGVYVPAQYMKLCPFKALYTRILNADNIFAGLSTFAVEMSELRDILRNATPYTLVLADELCSGTESTSALAIVASTIKWLSMHRSKFIFTTHLHDLPVLIDLDAYRVKVKHLHVEYDPISKKLIYDRSLREGGSSTLYGIEVSKAMDLPHAFIEDALAIRHRILGSTTQHDAKASAWNRSIVRKECEICCSQITKELEVHHIQHRATATNQLLADGTHMNDKRNLMVICQVCHDKIHGGSIEVGPMKQTSDGPERTVIHQQEEKEKKKKGKWSDEEMQTITDTLKKYTSLSLKAIKGLLHSKYEIEISESMLSKYKSTF